MHDMMETMMIKMFSGMSVEERVQFCSTMIPKCLIKVFAGARTEVKEKLKIEYEEQDAVSVVIFVS